MGFGNAFKNIQDRVQRSFDPGKEFEDSLDPKKAFRESLVPLIGEKKPISDLPIEEAAKMTTPAGGIRDINAERGRAALGGTNTQFNEPIPPYLVDKGYGG